MAKRTPPLCAYCDEPGVTRDHVPPKGLYARPLPHDLTTVPACVKHNNGASLDDEYFRAMLSFRVDTHDRSDAAGAATRALDRMTRRESEGFLRSFVAGITEHEVISPDGFVLGTAAAYDVDMPRLNSVVERIVRGLFFHHVGRQLPEHANVTVYALELFQKPDRATFDRLAGVIAWAAEAPPFVTARNVLEYKYRQTSDDPFGSVWLLKFYEAVPFVAVTTVVEPAG